MRILTVRQPWAWAIIHGGKDVENRSTNIAGDYRGPVAIHAALTGANFHARHADLWPFDDRHVTGAIIGVVDLVDVHEPFPGEGAFRGDTCSRWAEASVWHLVLANPRPLPTPIPYKGALGLRKLPNEITELIEGQLA